MKYLGLSEMDGSGVASKYFSNFSSIYKDGFLGIVSDDIKTLMSQEIKSKISSLDQLSRLDEYFDTATDGLGSNSNRFMRRLRSKRFLNSLLLASTPILDDALNGEGANESAEKVTEIKE